MDHLHFDIVDFRCEIMTQLNKSDYRLSDLSKRIQPMALTKRPLKPMKNERNLHYRRLD